MDAIFYTVNRKHIQISTITVKPTTVIRTDSYLEPPHCEITLPEDYKALIPLAGYVSFTDDDKLYQITETETQIAETTQYIIKADEVFSLILTRRITNEDRIFAYADNTPYTLHRTLGDLANGGLYPELAPEKAGYYGAISYNQSVDTEEATVLCIWEAGTTLFDYLQKEAKAHDMFVDFKSKLEQDTAGYHIAASAALCSYNVKPLLYLPTPEIVSLNIKEPLLPEYTETTFNETLHISGSNYGLQYKGVIATDYYNANYPVFDNAIRNTTINVTQTTADENILTSLTLSSLARYINNSAAPLPGVIQSTGGRYKIVPGDDYEYCYIHANSTITVKSSAGVAVTVQALTIACATETSLTAIKNWYSLWKNGAESNYLRTQMHDGKADDEKTLINGRYYYVLDIYATDTNTSTYTPVSVDYFVISKLSQTTEKISVVDHLDYIYTISLVAVEQKLISDYPKKQKDITVEFSEDATADVGDKIQVVAGRSLFAGVVTAKTETWENGTYKTDIEVKEWSAED